MEREILARPVSDRRVDNRRIYTEFLVINHVGIGVCSESFLATSERIRLNQLWSNPLVSSLNPPHNRTIGWTERIDRPNAEGRYDRCHQTPLRTYLQSERWR